MADPYKSNFAKRVRGATGQFAVALEALVSLKTVYGDRGYGSMTDADIDDTGVLAADVDAAMAMAAEVNKFIKGNNVTTGTNHAQPMNKVRNDV